MKKSILSLASALLLAFTANAQKVEFVEYDLSNGMHVILHQDNSVPVVTVGAMYHIGSKDETVGKTGMAHFYEHLLFTGTKNIPRGKWSDIQSSRGGSGNANTTFDRTYYYETFPSNEVELGLWMESERLMHPIIDQKAVDTQNEVVKEEKRQRMDNAPYGKIQYGMIFKHIFDKHPYKEPLIGYIKDLDNAKLSEFQDFYKKWYMPNNAVLVVAGDFETAKIKPLIEEYFGPIPKGNLPKRNKITEPERTQEKRVKEYDSNIQIPAILLSYVTPEMTSKDSKVLSVISTILSNGKSSRMYKKMVDTKKKALQIFSFSRDMEDYSVYNIGALPLGKVSLDELIKEMDEEIEKLQAELISDREFQKIKNIFENSFVSSNDNIESIANSLARNYMLMKDTNYINKELDVYNSITKEDIRRVAKKYLDKNRRVIIDYLPESKK